MSQARNGSRTAFPILVAIETDTERSAGKTGAGDTMLGQGDAEQMLAHLAADLGSLIKDIRHCHLAAAGVLFDQCQILRPGTPVFTALSDVPPRSAGKGTTPALTAIGSKDGVMSDPSLHPDQQIPRSPLRLLPILVSGSEEVMAHLSEEMEHRFLAEGQVSAHTASWLEAAFGIGIGHARFMTLTDVNAMFRLQLEHFGFLPLWELIDAAVSESRDELEINTENGTRYGWREGRACVEFQTFDFWAAQGSGRDVASDDEEFARRYAIWCRELRRYSSTLAAHHVPLRFELPDERTGQVSEHHLFEEVDAPVAAGAQASITEHAWPELGTVAVTARLAESLRHYYPLTPQGLGEIHEILGTVELKGEGLAFPGTIRFDPASRRLRPGRF
jgi:hypothetical protein